MLYRIRMSNGHFTNWTYEKLFKDHEQLGLNKQETDEIFFNIGKEVNRVSIVGGFER